MDTMNKIHRKLEQGAEITFQTPVNPLLIRKSRKLDFIPISLFNKAKRDYLPKVYSKMITITDFNQGRIFQPSTDWIPQSIKLNDTKMIYRRH